MTSKHAISVRDILFLDNGGYNIKALYLPVTVRTHELSSSASIAPPTIASIVSQHSVVVPNCVGAASYAGRGIIGSQLHQLPHYHGLMVRRPVSGVSGFIVDGVLQAYIWEYILQSFSIEDESKVELWLTVPFGVTKAVVALLNVLLTQHFHFHSVTFVSPSFLCLISYEYHHLSTYACDVRSACSAGAADMSCCRDANTSAPRRGSEVVYGDSLPGRKRGRRGDDHDGSTAEGTRLLHSVDEMGYFHGSGIVVDAGFSSTTIVPYIDYCPVYSSIVRNEVGGKVLTNRLKEYLSYTQINLMEDGWLVNHIKEQCCAVVPNAREMLRSYEAYARGSRHVLHDSATARQGHLSALPVESNVSAPSTAPARIAAGSPSSCGDGCPNGNADSVGTVATTMVYILPTVPALYPLGFTASTSSVPRIKLAMRTAGDGDGDAQEEASEADTESSDDDAEDDSCDDNSERGTNNGTPHPRRKRTDKTSALSDRSILDGLLATQKNSSCLQVLRLRHERFLIPEIIFTPADIGVSPGSGLVHAITEICERRGLLKYLPLMRRVLCSQVYVYGGSSQFPGFLSRLRLELQAVSENGPGDTRDTAFGAAKMGRFTEPPHHGLNLKSSTEYNEREVNGALNASPPSGVTSISECHPVGSAELQPLFGACVLLTQRCAAHHRERVVQRSRVELASISHTRTVDEVMHRAMQNIL